jgi:hypothetical protein
METFISAFFSGYLLASILHPREMLQAEGGCGALPAMAAPHPAMEVWNQATIIWRRPKGGMSPAPGAHMLREEM